MAQCAYHPEVRASASCPTCHNHICDRCRMNGAGDRCQTCQSNHARGSESSRLKREMCTNHADVPADQRCIRCKKVHCPACLNGAKKCFRCALLPDKPATGKLKSKGTGKLKGGGTALLKLPGGLTPAALKQGAAGVAVAVVLVLGVKTAMPYLKKAPPPAPYNGPAKVEIVSPSHKKTLTGNQVITMKVTAADKLEKLELTIDGKHWERLKKGPFVSDWPTQIFKNGNHKLVVRATYKGGKKVATATRNYKTKNKL